MFYRCQIATLLQTVPVYFISARNMDIRKARSEQQCIWSSGVELEIVYLPPPYKEDEAHVTCFSFLQIREEMSKGKTLDGLFLLLVPNTLDSGVIYVFSVSMGSHTVL